MPNQKSGNSKMPQSLTAPRYTEIATFMRTPIITDPSDYDLAIVGIPYDGAVTNRPGARHGPRELRNSSSLMRTIHHVTKVNPYELCRIGDGGDVRFTRIYEIEPSLEEITQHISHFHNAGVVPLSAGGDHSITLPIMRAIATNGPIGLIHIDAHTDTWDEFMGSKYMHGTPFRRAVEENLLDPKRTIQIGIRGAQTSSEGWDYSEKIGMRMMFIEEFNQLGVEAVIREARQIVGDRPTYISFDIDSLDPVYAPGTGTPEIGGLTTIQAQGLLRGLRGLDLIGADVVEVSPPFDPSGNTALVGATIMFEILCLLAETISKKG
ncbi:MAG: agmatinase [Anaerolineae bacterium]|nr:agmatinase [Anaerolineae bacterium]MDK1080688.1 agmatinase [Anaerolineae bacterium]MDK1117685.1 agmatinase [Anaerolineae bacterium]